MTITVIDGKKRQTIPARGGQDVLEALQAAGIPIQAPCGGRGMCDKCRVILEDGSTVRACRTLVRDGLTVRLPQAELDTLLEGAAALSSTDGEEGYALACDIGTTTVVLHLLRLRDGARLGTLGGANPQSVFGADVISRISACAQGQQGALQAAIQTQLGDFARRLLAQAGVDAAQVRRMTVAGNTTMCHLLTGLDPASIGAAPFTPQSLFGDVWSLELGPYPVWISPCVSGYVGGDITAGLLAAGLHQSAVPCLFLDVGTNGEMALGGAAGFVCCATAAGPAFEGAEIALGMAAQSGAVSGVDWDGQGFRLTVVGGGAPVGLCGSGLIDALAAALELGLVDETGRVADRTDLDEGLRGLVDEAHRVLLTPDGAIYLTQGDIRKLQLAKAAIAAGIRLLLQDAGLTAEQVPELVLAGGFGSRIRPRSAGRIGLLPREFVEKTRPIGNAAGEGAVSAAVSGEARRALLRLRDSCRYLELSTHRGFSEAFIEEMYFD